MKKAILTLPVLALTALVLLASGCGGGDSSDATPTKAEFIKKADAICKKADGREAGEFLAYARKNASEFNTSRDQGLEKALLVILVPSIQKEVEEMKALGIPEGDEKELEKYFAEVETALEEVEEEPLSVEERRPKSPLFGAFKLGQAYGFKSCNELY